MSRLRFKSLSADLQNTYAKHVADNNAVVSNLAQQANTL